MTRHARDGQPDLIAWAPGDEPDWATPDSVHGDHAYCGNCGLDTPGCGCPRGVLNDALGHAPGGGLPAALILATQLAEERARPLIQVTIPEPANAAELRERFAGAVRAVVPLARVLPPGGLDLEAQDRWRPETTVEDHEALWEQYLVRLGIFQDKVRAGHPPSSPEASRVGILTGLLIAERLLTGEAPDNVALLPGKPSGLHLRLAWEQWFRETFPEPA